MEEQVDRLVRKMWEKYQETPPSKRLLLGVSGIPGSGKTTLASTVTKRLNDIHKSKAPGCATIPPAVFVPMDGYHLSRAQLDTLPDPTTAHARRGAAFTFDPESFLILVRKLREPLLPESQTLYAPSFDHAIKDPKQDDVVIPTSARIVMLEGNYLSLSTGAWREAAELMDELWFVEVDLETARRRLVARHVKAGIAKDVAEAHKRVTENDLVNGQEIMDKRLEVQEVIVSREDEEWSPRAQGV